MRSHWMTANDAKAVLDGITVIRTLHHWCLYNKDMYVIEGGNYIYILYIVVGGEKNEQKNNGEEIKINR